MSISRTGGISYVVCTSGTRPAGPSEGMMIYETDTNLTLVYDGTVWVEIAALGEWTIYTPELTALTTNPTLGTGSTQSGRYRQVARTITGWAYIKFGTSGVAAGSGAYFISLPVAPFDPDLPDKASTANPTLGTGKIRDASGPANKLVNASVYTPRNAMLLVTMDAAATVTESAPWTWAASDFLTVQFAYEAA